VLAPNQTKFERKHLLEMYMNALSETLSGIGFKKTSFDRYLRKTEEGSQAFTIVWRSRREMGVLSVAVTPIVHSNFPAVQKIAKLMGRDADLPSLGGALGIFTPLKSMKEFWISSLESVDAAAIETRQDISDWGTLFWKQTESIESTFQNLSLINKGPSIETEAAMRYLKQGIDAAIECVSYWPQKRVTADEKAEMIQVLKGVNLVTQEQVTQPKKSSQKA